MTRLSRPVVVLLLLLLLVPSVSAGPPAAFLEKAKRYYADEPDRLPALRAQLARQVPDLFYHPLPTCPLRSALAKAFTPAEARALLVAVIDDEKALPVVVDNLAARRDLPSLVLDTGAYPRLEASAPALLVDVALNGLLDGDAGLVRRLLEGPVLERMAAALAALPRPEGLRTLADVVTGAAPLSAAARARLAAWVPNLHNARPTCPLGPARVEALRRVAGEDEDPALRALASRLLLRAFDPGIATQTVRAFVDARSAHLERDDWTCLGKLAPLVVTDPRVAIENRLALLESWTVWTWVRAEQDPLRAEVLARRLRAALAKAGPRFRGEAVLLLVDHDTLFVTTTHGRKRAVPSMRGILDDLEAGRPGDPPALTALGREAAARLRAAFAEEEAYPEVRQARRPLRAEAAWRPAPPRVDTALAGVIEGIDGVEAFGRALARLADARLPPSSRFKLFEQLRDLARDGMTAAQAEAEADGSFDGRYFARLSEWLVTSAGALDGGLAERVIAGFVDGIPEGEEKRGWGAFDRAVDTVHVAGPRLRLEALREATRSWR